MFFDQQSPAIFYCINIRHHLMPVDNCYCNGCRLFVSPADLFRLWRTIHLLDTLLCVRLGQFEMRHLSVWMHKRCSKWS